MKIGWLGLIALAWPVASCTQSPVLETFCDEGFEKNADGTQCVPKPWVCEVGAVRSLAERCAEQSRFCVEDELGASCGPCTESHREDSTGTCVALLRCSELSCEAGGLNCVETPTGATCEGCLGGLVVGDDGACVVPNCAAPTVPGSLEKNCLEQRRSCVELSGEGSCGDCLPGFVEEGSVCRSPVECASLLCASANRFCIDGPQSSDALCGGCLPGFVERSGVCEADFSMNCQIDGTNSIEANCREAHRECVLSSGGGARCGACEGAFVESSSTGFCVAVQSCDDLACDAVNRDCVVGDTAECKDCSAGYVEDPNSGVCRNVLTCDALACADGEECIEATSDEDALCRPACTDTSIWNGERCEACPPCDDVGERGIWPRATASGQCICETETGYFYALSADIGSFQCDADGDGWVRESARNALTTTDPALHSNARCALRTIDEVKLTNESGGTKIVALEAPVSLYESDRNDDDGVLNAIWESRGLEQYGVGPRRTRASELNRMTKLCHTALADYNDNGVPDVEEWGQKAIAPVLLAEQAVFNEFSYFVELHRGWYEPPAGGVGFGRYVVAERSRVATDLSPEDVVSMPYRSSAGNYWRVCEVDRDSEWSTQEPPVGMDFAQHYDPGSPSTWEGMSHHSQYKCLVLDEDSDLDSPAKASAATLLAEGHHLSRCHTQVAATDVVGNPSGTSIVCESIEVPELSPGDTMWAGVDFHDYGPDAPDRDFYRRGCINECIEAVKTCEGYDLEPAAARCVYARDDFGRFETCDLWEICDGLDNDGDGVPDDNINPEEDYRLEQGCDTGATGLCMAGTTQCVGGGVSCIQDSPAEVEICNGINDNCDASNNIDEGLENMGSCDTGLDGICAAGQLSCVNGSPSCLVLITPNSQSENCDGQDNDCDGMVDEAPTGSCESPWSIYYKDADGDGYGESIDPGRCQCAAAGVYSVTNNDDCCDSDSGSKPGAGYSSSANDCGSNDRNCDGQVSKRYTRQEGSGCGIGWFECKSSASGWTQLPIPACGNTADYYNGCSGLCGQNTTSRTQSCK